MSRNNGNSDHPRGSLIIIGGHEQKEGNTVILEEVARRAKEGKGLILVTVATHEPEELAKDYRKAFKELGLNKFDVLDIRTREEAHDPKNVEKVMKSSVVFFTGGDQLRITSQIGDSPIFTCLHDIYANGGTIVGTSAGAAAMSGTMLISGGSYQTTEISAIGMAPGLRLMPDVVIDTHFAERGRIGRLVGAVAQNPANLGIGIDEDTAILVHDEEGFTVIGSGGVYVVDGRDIAYSSLSESRPEGKPSIFGVKLHILGEGDVFDLVKREPVVSAEALQPEPELVGVNEDEK
ncbi:MAG: cyanophycinase [Chloroflexia bacterium]|jgi:cyanophycinase|nr:cyanophycinase [Chloroflexia bacterium]